MADVLIRPIAPDDHARCATVLYDAFHTVAEHHGFTSGFRSLADTARVVELFARFPVIRGLVAEVDGRVAGVVYLDEGDPIKAIALIGVDPAAQSRGIGRRLMEAALARTTGARGVRLTQEAFNVAAMSLYASLGFEVKEPLVRITGAVRPIDGAGRVRRLTDADLAECGRLTERVHGIDRNVDLRDAIATFDPFGLVRDGRITACTYAVFGSSLSWGVAETERDLRELIAGVGTTLAAPLTLMFPTRQAAMFRWLLAQGFRVEKPMTLMARGEYTEPRGAWFPSGFY